MLDTKNIKFAAYLRLQGIHPENVEKIGRGKGRYFFALDEEKWQNLKKDFDRSDLLKYAQCLDAVVDLAH